MLNIIHYCNNNKWFSSNMIYHLFHHVYHNWIYVFQTTLDVFLLLLTNLWLLDIRFKTTMDVFLCSYCYWQNQFTKCQLNHNGMHGYFRVFSTSTTQCERFDWNWLKLIEIDWNWLKFPAISWNFVPFLDIDSTQSILFQCYYIHHPFYSLIHNQYFTNLFNIP